jgi:hypothetical protein
MITGTILSLLIVQQSSAPITPPPMQFRMECKMMDVPNIKGPEVSVSATEPKVIYARTTKFTSTPTIRTVESMPASVSVADPNGNENKILMTASRIPDGRYNLRVEISNTLDGKSDTQKVDVKMNAHQWVQIISKSRKRVVTIRLEPALD